MNEEVRLVGNGEHEEDMWQYSLRPKFFNEYVGQEEAKGNLNVYIQAAKQRGEALDLSLIHISEPTRLALISYAVFCLKKKN